MLGLPDAYTVRARIFPALIAAMPAIALIAAFVSWKDLSLSHGLAGTALLAILWLFSDRARRRGKEIEPLLFAKIGGMPSTVMLRHSGHTFDVDTKRRIHLFLADKLKEAAPTADEEARNPLAADAFYERGGTWLREHTRDTKKFNILFDENMTYGARRNLLGLKTYALGLNVAVVVISVAVIFLGSPVDVGEGINNRLVVVLIVAAIHAACVFTFVNEQGLFQAARQYGRQLLLSCEALQDPKAAKGTAAGRSKKRLA